MPWSGFGIQAVLAFQGRSRYSLVWTWELLLVTCLVRSTCRRDTIRLARILLSTRQVRVLEPCREDSSPSPRRSFLGKYQQ